MTNEELKNLTAYFSDVKPLIDSHKYLAKETSKVRRRLNTKLKTYSFLKDIVGEGDENQGNKLVNAVIDLLKEIGFNNIENVDKKNRDEDIQLWTNNLLIIFEITGTDKPSTTDDKAHRISKHIPTRQTSYPEFTVSGVFIVNHDYNKHYTKRNKRPFRDGIIEIAKSHKYSLLTTVTLLELYLAVKTNKLTLENVVDLFCKGGEIKNLEP